MVERVSTRPEHRRRQSKHHKSPDSPVLLAAPRAPAPLLFPFAIFSGDAVRVAVSRRAFLVGGPSWSSCGDASAVRALVRRCEGCAADMLRTDSGARVRVPVVMGVRRNCASGSLSVELEMRGDVSCARRGGCVCGCRGVRGAALVCYGRRVGASAACGRHVLLASLLITSEPCRCSFRFFEVSSPFHFVKGAS